MCRYSSVSRKLSSKSGDVRSSAAVGGVAAARAGMRVRHIADCGLRIADFTNSNTESMPRLLFSPDSLEFSEGELGGPGLEYAALMVRADRHDREAAQEDH